MRLEEHSRALCKEWQEDPGSRFQAGPARVSRANEVLV